jgi:isoquinoline 1-oxidoreductase beta subunit
MTNEKNNQSRRSFLKVTSLTGGGMMIGISWFANLIPNEAMAQVADNNNWVQLNGFIQITPDNQVKIFNPNPEFGTNVMTSLPMMVNEELEADWSKVKVEMGDYDTPRFKSQFTGGSRAMAMAWMPLRTAGATARLMLMQAAANQWGVPVSELRTEKGEIVHINSGKRLTYGEVATAACKIAQA